MSKFMIEKQEYSDIVILQLKLCVGNKFHTCDKKNHKNEASNGNQKTVPQCSHIVTFSQKFLSSSSNDAVNC
jgi:hypothetical protein